MMFMHYTCFVCIFGNPRLSMLRSSKLVSQPSVFHNKSNVLQLGVPRGTHGLKVLLWAHTYFCNFYTCTCLEDIFGNFRRANLPVSIRPCFFYLMYICPFLGRQLNWRFRKRTLIFLCTTFYKVIDFPPSGSSCRFWSNVLSCTAYIVCLYIYIEIIM